MASGKDSDLDSVLEYLTEGSRLSPARMEWDEDGSLPEELVDDDDVLQAEPSTASSSGEEGEPFDTEAGHSRDASRLEEIMDSIHMSDDGDEAEFSRERDDLNTELDRVLHSARSWTNIFHGQQPSPAQERLVRALVLGTGSGPHEGNPTNETTRPSTAGTVHRNEEIIHSARPTSALSHHSVYSYMHESPSQIPSIRSSVDFELDAEIKLVPKPDGNGTPKEATRNSNRRYSDIVLDRGLTSPAMEVLPAVEEIQVWEGVRDLLDDMSNRYQHRIERKKRAIVEDAQPLHEHKVSDTSPRSKTMLPSIRFQSSVAGSDILEPMNEPGRGACLRGHYLGESTPAAELELPPSERTDRTDVSEAPVQTVTFSMSHRARNDDPSDVATRPATSSTAGPVDKRVTKLKGEAKRKTRVGTAGSERGSCSRKATTGRSTSRISSPRKLIKRKSKGTRSAFGGRSEQATCLAALDGEVRCVASSGKEVWCGERHGLLTVRNVLSGAVIEEIDIGDNLVSCLLFIDSKVWVGTGHGWLLIYDKGSKSCVREVSRAHGGGIHCMMAGMGRVWTASNDFSIHEWDLETYARRRTYRGHSNGVRCLVLVGPMLWSGSDDGTIRVWGTRESPLDSLAVLRGHTASVQALVSTSKYVWSASQDGTVRMWDILSFECFKTVSLPEGTIPNALVPMGGQLWCCGGAKNIYILSQQTGEVTRKFSSKHSYVSGLAKVKQVETRVLWSWSASDKTVHIWKRDKVNDSDLAEHITDVLNSNRLLRAQAARLNDELLEVQEERAAAARHSQGERAVLIAQIEDLTLKLVSQANQSMESKCPQKPSSENSARMSSEVLHLREEREAIQAHYAQLEDHLRRSEENQAIQIREWEEDRSYLLKEISELRSEAEALRGELDHSKQQHARTKAAMQSTIDSVKQDLIDVEKAKFQTEELHLETHSEKATLADEVRVKDRVILNTQAKCELLEVENSELLAETEVLRSELRSTRGKLQSLVGQGITPGRVAADLKSLDQALAKCRSGLSNTVSTSALRTLPLHQRAGILEYFKQAQTSLGSAKEICRALLAMINS